MSSNHTEESKGQQSSNVDIDSESQEWLTSGPGEKNTRKNELLKKIAEYKQLRPHIIAEELVKVLIKDGVCTHQTVPDVDNVYRVLDHIEGRKSYEEYVRGDGGEADHYDEYFEDQYDAEQEEEDESILLKNEDIFTEQQLRVLKKEYKKCSYPAHKKAEEIADLIGTHYDLVYAYGDAVAASKTVEAVEKEFETEEVTEVEDVRDENCEEEVEEELKLTEEQKQELEKVYKCVTFPDIFARDELAEKLDLEETEIRKWFFNRRARSRRERNVRKEQMRTVFNTDFTDFTFLDHIMNKPTLVAPKETIEVVRDSNEKTAMMKKLEKMRGDAAKKKKRAQDMLIEVEATLRAIDEMEKAFDNKEPVRNSALD